MIINAAVTRPGAASSVGPPTTIIDAAVLLDPTEISQGQPVIFNGVFARRLQAMLRDGCTHLITLTSCWRTLRVTLCRQQRDHGYDWDYAHSFKPHKKPHTRDWLRRHPFVPRKDQKWPVETTTD